MHPKWIISLAILFLGGTLLANILEGQYITSGETTLLFDLLNKYKEINFGNPVTGFFTMISAGWEYLIILWRIFWWDYAMFYGTYEIARYFALCISLGVIGSLVLAVTRGTSSA